MYPATRKVNYKVSIRKSLLLIYVTINPVYDGRCIEKQLFHHIRWHMKNLHG